MRPAALRLFLAAALLGAALTARAGLLGSTVHVNLLYPDRDTPYADLGDAVVGPGAEYEDANQSVILDFDDATLTLTSALSGPFAAAPFNGYDVTLASPGLRFVGASLLPGSGFSPAVTVDDGHLYVNFGGNLSAARGAVATIRLAAVPEPAALLPLALGVAALRRRRDAG